MAFYRSRDSGTTNADVGESGVAVDKNAFTKRDGGNNWDSGGPTTVAEAEGFNVR